MINITLSLSLSLYLSLYLSIYLSIYLCNVYLADYPIVTGVARLIVIWASKCFIENTGCHFVKEELE